MPKSIRCVLLLLLALSAGPGPTAAQSVQYRVVTLQSPSITTMFPEDINDNNLVVGDGELRITENIRIAPRPLIYDGAVHDIAMGDDQGRVIAVNNLGQMVGDASPESAAFRAFLYDNGTMQDLGTLGGIYSQARGINDAGVIVGTSDINQPLPEPVIWPPPQEPYFVIAHAFMYQNGAMQNLHTLASLPGEQSAAQDINDAGAVVGAYWTPHDEPGGTNRHGFIWSNGQLIDFADLGFTSSIPLRINEDGVAVGMAQEAGGSTRGLVYSNGRAVLLGAFGGESSIARDVNDLGQIVGQASTGELVIGGGEVWRALLYHDGVLTDLNTLIPQGTGWVLENAAAINNSGLIVGHGMFNGVNTGFLLIPVPEPAAGVCLVSLMVPILGFARRSDR